MNGKIKTKFAALFAVALMITVCVVPMVGNDQGADGLDAVYTPGVDSEDYVTITGKVYNAAGSAWTAGGKVVASYDTSYKFYADIDAAGKYELVLYGGAEKEITINVDKASTDFDGVVNPAYGFDFDPVIITSAKAGQKYIADFATGKKMISGTFVFANNESITSDLGYSASNFTVKIGYESETAVTGTDVIDENGFKFTALVDPTWDTTKLKVSLTSSDDTISNIANVEWDGSKSIKVNESLGKATASNELKGYGITVDSITVNGTAGTDVVKLIAAQNKIDSEKNAAFTYSLQSTDAEFTFNVIAEGEFTITVDAGSDVTLTPDEKVLYGTVKMGDIYAADNLQVSIKYTHGTDGASTQTVKVKNGYYAYPVSETITGISEISFPDNAQFVSSSTSSSGKLDISVNSSGFQLISGYASYNNSYADATLVLTGINKVFGAGASIAVTSSGYAFYAQKGVPVTISGSDITPASVTLTPGSTSITQNFTIASQEITFQANDASNVLIESSDIDVYYAYVTESGDAFKTATYTKVDLVDGKATIKINKLWDLKKLFVYYDGGNTGYTFAAGSKDTSIAYQIVTGNPGVTSNPGATQPAEQQVYTFTVKDSSDGSELLSGVKVKFGEYKVDAIGSDKKSYISVGATKEVAVENGKVSILLEKSKLEAGCYIAEVIVPSTSKEIFKNPYYITYNSTTGYTSEFKAVSSSNLINGTVTTDNDVPLAGMEVSIVDADDKVVGTAVTDMLGKFYVNYEKPAAANVLSVIVKDKAGIYTFDEVDAYTVNVVESEQSVVTGTVKKDGKIILDSETISAAVYDADGKKLQEVKVGADGKFKVAYKANDEIVVTDSSKVQTFTVTIDTSGYTAVAISNLTTVEYIVYDVYGTGNALVEGAEVVMVNNSTGALIGDKVVTGKDGKATFTYDKSLNGMFTVKALASAGEYNEASANEYKKIYLDAPLVTYTLADAEDKNSDRFEGFKIVKYMADANSVYQAAKEYTADEKGQFKAFGNSPQFLITGEGYTFGSVNTYDGRVTAVSGALKANEQDLVASVKDKSGNFGIPGVTVEIFNKNDKVILTGVTDLNGEYKFIAKDDVKALAKSGETDYGTFKFDDEKIAVSNVIKADKNVYYGTYAEGKVIDGVSVTYEIMNGTSLVEAGNASIVEDKYYIATDETGTSVKITATANLFYAQVTGALGDMNLMVQYVKPVSVEVKQAVYGVQVLGADNAVIGSVLTLIAPNEYSMTIDATQDVVQKYKFAGWYVNGEKVSDSNITTYTIKGECNVYADYEVSTYETGVVADESNGLSMDVLILGIVIVVLGLLAFAYAVKFKKE